MSSAGVLLLTGPPCAGKTSVGRALTALPAADPRWVHLQVDALFTLLTPDSDRNRDDRMLAYDAAHRLARLLVERGRIPVLECTYSRREQRVSLLQGLGHSAAPLHVVELEVSGPEAVARFSRRRQVTDLDDQLVRERAESFPRHDGALRLDTAAETVPGAARRVAQWLAQGPPGVDRTRWAAAGKD